MAESKAWQKHFLFEVEGLPPATFSVVDFAGTEAVSRLFRFTLTLLGNKSDHSPEEILNRHATFTIGSLRDGKEARTPYRGMVERFSALHQAGAFTFYEVVFVSRFERLSSTLKSEVYTGENTLPEIFGQLLDQQGFRNGTDFRVNLSGQYRPRSFLFQYQETDRDFLFRHAENNGIYHYIDHEGERDVLTLIDSRASQPSWSRTLSYRPAAELDIGLTDDSLKEWTSHTRLLPKEVVILDFNYRKSSLTIEQRQVVSAEGVGTVTFSGDSLRTQQEARERAKIRAEEFLCRKEVFQGTATATGIRAASVITVQKHFRETSNGRFFVTEVLHEGSQATTLLSGTDVKNPRYQRQTYYECRLTAIRADLQFRPERMTPKPSVAGVIAAFIEAEGSGKFAEVNEYGEYKIRFPFLLEKKRPQKGSGWVRLSTPLAGADNGMHFPLHHDTEVLVAFIGGDPDQPVLIGALHNSEHRNLVTNQSPERNVIHSIGGHKIILNDAGYA